MSYQPATVIGWSSSARSPAASHLVASDRDRPARPRALTTSSTTLEKTEPLIDGTADMAATSHTRFGRPGDALERGRKSGGAPARRWIGLRQVGERIVRRAVAAHLEVEVRPAGV